MCDCNNTCVIANTLRYVLFVDSFPDDVSPRLKTVQPIVWVLQNLTLLSAILVTVVFWLFIYPCECSIWREKIYAI